MWIDSTALLQGPSDALDDKKIAKQTYDQIYNAIRRIEHKSSSGRYVVSHYILLKAINVLEGVHWTEWVYLWEYLGKSIASGIDVGVDAVVDDEEKELNCPLCGTDNAPKEGCENYFVCSECKGDYNHVNCVNCGEGNSYEMDDRTCFECKNSLYVTVSELDRIAAYDHRKYKSEPGRPPQNVITSPSLEQLSEDISVDNKGLRHRSTSSGVFQEPKARRDANPT